MKHSTKYLEDFVFSMSKTVTNPESAELMNELYYETFFPKNIKSVESMFCTVLQRDYEDTSVYTRYEEALDDYIRLDIKKFFNISVTEYLDLTPYSRNIYNRVANENIKQLQIEIENIKNGQKSALNKIQNSGYTDEELFNG